MKAIFAIAISLLTIAGRAQQNTFPNSGNVGIGTTTPATALEVNGETRLDGNLSVGNGTAGDIVSFRGDGAGPFVGSYNSVPLRLGTTYAERMRITATGYVGIGRTNPTAVLQVVNSVNADGQVGFQVNQATGGDLDLTAARIQSTDDGNYIRFLHKTSSWSSGDYIDANGLFNDKYSGNVGIGTTTPGEKLDVAGNIKLSGGGASIVFPNGSAQSVAWTGTSTDSAYSVRRRLLVAGVYSTRPGVLGRRQLGQKSDQEIPMAMVGIVPTKVSAENGPIKRGDLLVTSSTAGNAMKGTDSSRMLGAVVGKAMGMLDTGTGVIDVLVSLQ
jgi:hypothetical protein